MSYGGPPDLPRVPSAGRPLTGQRKHQSDESAYKIVSIRLRSAEFESFFDQANALGLTSNLALRIAARRIAGFLEIDQAMRGQLEKITAAIGEISENLGRLHGAYVESGKVDPGELARQRVAFGHEFAELDASLRSILNVSRRRTDGRRLLEKATT